MRKLMAIALLALSMPLLCAAEESVGRLSARGGVKLDGIAVPTAGIPSWPLHQGSVIETDAYPASVMLGGGKRMEVPAHSTAIVEAGPSGAPMLRYRPGRVLRRPLRLANRLQLAQNSAVPSTAPSTVPNVAPSTVPSVAPSTVPSVAPSTVPSVAPSVVPSVAPSVVPSVAPAVPPMVEISVVGNDPKDELGDPPAGGPPCSSFPPILVNLGLVRCTP